MDTNKNSFSDLNSTGYNTISSALDSSDHHFIIECDETFYQYNRKRRQIQIAYI